MVTVVRALSTPQGKLVAPIADGGGSPMAPDARARTIGPFTIVAHFDSTFAPSEAPRDLDVRPHPHIGLATLSYLYAGAITHRDGIGNVAEIAAGDLAWMVTGRGVVHSERMTAFRARGGRLHGFQIWVALEARDEDCEPSFENVRAADVRTSEAPGVRVRELLVSRPRAPAGAWMCDVEIARDATYEAPSSSEGALYVVEGTIAAGEQTLGAGAIATFTRGDDRRFVAREPARALAFGGEPIGPRWLWWNYLHSSKERIEEMKRAWREMAMPLPADDRDEHIPLPADHERPLRLLNGA
ncbi:MAG TPA: pirin family protein [Labilithrix sp.]|jgi:hypothetical protein